jgi:hypothetical protein
VEVAEVAECTILRAAGVAGRRIVGVEAAGGKIVVMVEVDGRRAVEVVDGAELVERELHRNGSVSVTNLTNYTDSEKVEVVEGKKWWASGRSWKQKRIRDRSAVDEGAGRVEEEVQEAGASLLVTVLWKHSQGVSSFPVGMPRSLVRPYDWKRTI